MITRKDIERLTLYTGSNGKKGCTCNCVGCSQERYGTQTPYYQGTKEQIKELLRLAPYIKDCIILGNPDPNVDPEFCNWVARYMIKNGIRVRFSSSGINALEVIKILFKNLDKNYVDYMSYSIDSIDKDISLLLKGNRIPFEDVDEAIEYCLASGVHPKIQPTLWNLNKDCYKELIEYYLKREVKWFSFHLGSFESFDNEKRLLKHLTPEEWITIRNDLSAMSKDKKFSIHMPYIFMNEVEYTSYRKERGDKCYPIELKNTQVWLEKDKLRTTHCPLLREVRCFEYDLKDFDMSNVDFSISETGYCPATSKAVGIENCEISINGFGDEFIVNGIKYYTICRSYNYNYNRPIIY